MSGDLAGRRILVPESRELDLFAQMLEARGAETLRCPLVTILDSDDPAPIETWLDRLAAGRFDDLILLTGEGLRRLMAVARRTGRDAAVVAALGRLRTITRGPKPAKALREIGLAPGLAAGTPTTEGVIESLAQETLTGRTVAVQLYPGNPNALLLDFLRRAGAAPDPVLPYRYASDTESDRVAETIETLATGGVDAVAFTSSPQVARLVEVAAARGLQGQLADGLARTRVAAVGPVVAAALRDIGARVDIQPSGSFFMKPLVNALAAALGPGGG
jgi:uroporphyrinogen-III synthase